MITFEKYPPYMLREELGLTNTQIARESHLTDETVRQAFKSTQRNKNVNKTTAYNILAVFNKHRAKRGLPELSIADLDWKVRGYTE